MTHEIINSSEEAAGQEARIAAGQQAASEANQSGADIKSGRPWRIAGRVATVATLAVSLFAGGDFVADAHTSAQDLALPAAELYPDTPYPDPQPEIPPPDTSALEMVNFLLDQPADYDVAHYWVTVSSIQGAHPEQSFDRIKDQELFKLRKKIADRHALTVYDPTDTLAKLRDSDEGKHVLSITEYMAAANRFLNQYDGLSVGTDSRLSYSYNLQAAPKKIVDTEGRPFIRGLVQAIAAEPAEDVEQMGITRYLMASQIPHEPDSVAGAYMDLDRNEVVDNISVTGSTALAQENIYHEQGHQFQDNESGGGGLNDDSGFRFASADVPYGLVGSEPKPGKPDMRHSAASEHGVLTVPEYSEKTAHLEEDMQESYGKPDCAEEARIADMQLQNWGDRTLLPTDYAATDQPEHVAEIEKYVEQSDMYVTMLDPHLPAINDEFKFVLARRYQYHPRITQYYIDMATKPNRANMTVDEDPHFFADMCSYYANPANLKRGTTSK